jgi:hypothetical protein
LFIADSTIEHRPIVAPPRTSLAFIAWMLISFFFAALSSKLESSFDAFQDHIALPKPVCYAPRAKLSRALPGTPQTLYTFPVR